ncbi:MAG: ATP-dependent DNA helicase RecG [Polaribacter sp.]
MNLQHPVTYIKGISLQKAALLFEELGIKTCNDLLFTFPFRYIDKTKFYKISDLLPTNAEVQIVGRITQLKTVNQKRGSRLVATFQDNTGTMELVWFRGQKWIQKYIKINQPYVVFGKLNHFNGSFSIPHPEMELLTEYKKKLQSSMQPVYNSTEKLTNAGISNKVFRGYIETLFKEIQSIPVRETLSSSILKENQFISKKEALIGIHFPKNQQQLAQAQERLKFEELFFLQLQLIKKNLINKERLRGYRFEKVGSLFNDFYRNQLPFDLTNAQKRVLKEIRKDVGNGAHMNRLLQGDVGSGKTIVALLAMLLAIDNGYQATLMAPTEILATQHFESLSELLSEMNVPIALLTGSTKTKRRKEIHTNLENGQLKILIGTHALLEDVVKYNKLGLAIIDEQHRFGVKQRAKLWHKNQHLDNGNPPHILVMTATPIPRTLAMTLYGDIDVSVINELPPGRKDVKTVLRTDKNRLGVYRFLKEEIAKGRQVYIVYPLIEESETLDYKDLMDGYDSILREFPRPKYQVSVVHGKMKPEDKDFEMQRFIKKQTQIMVATTVIEVGVNVPNASVMVIESAQRFGLSQLHQLRGRVGRGSSQSYCILLADHKVSAEGKERLQTMVSTNDGFKIAEVDLKLRGPGNIMGTQQSGMLNFKIANLSTDNVILSRARNSVIKLLKADPNLISEENESIRNTYDKLSRESKIWSNIS